jgi:hypothetical protein
MKTLLADYLRHEQESRETEKSRCLAELKAALSPYVEVAKSSLPEIESALLEADLWVKENLSVAPSKKWPENLQRLVFSLEGPRQNPSVIRQALKELDQLTEADCWGRRSDGERDVNRAAQLKEDFKYRLHVANGCANGIKKTLGYIQTEAAKFEEWLEYQRLIEANETAQPATIVEPVKKAEGEKPSVTKAFDARALW